jgi:tRNA(Ile)-lysidine synthase
LSARHIDALDALLTSWSGQGAVHLPGGIRVRRSSGRLVAETDPVTDF